ncbi:MAG: GerMN domain-containing protein [Acidobacteria bacterium]|nr:GerMN domain-containing protein [Acidobacteriota bacterium]
MTGRRLVLLSSGAVLSSLLALGCSNEGDAADTAPRTSPVVATDPAMSAEVPRIAATLFFASPDGRALVPVLREVALAEGLVPQGREILNAQLQGPPPPYGPVMPAGTQLRAFYVTERGDAFVDLSFATDARHIGGTSAELLAVYAIVHAVTANLTTIQRVQILIDGREADTLAGHVDLRRPLEPDMSTVRGAGGAR